MTKQLLTILYPGFAEWEVAFPRFCVYPGVEYRFAAIGERRVRGTMGFEIEAERTIEDVDPEGFDGVYLPGGRDPVEGRFPRSLGEHEGLKKILRRFADRGKVVAAICGTPLVLGAAGLLNERDFACDITEDTRGWLARGRRADGLLAIDGRILTASVQALLPFSAALARLLGEERTAEEIEEFFNLGEG
ncbi:MAG: DJ-1/PfpI family protein [Candidatus Bipolaricaulia bacterium]